MDTTSAQCYKTFFVGISTFGNSNKNLESFLNLEYFHYGAKQGCLRTMTWQDNRIQPEYYAQILLELVWYI